MDNTTRRHLLHLEHCIQLSLPELFIADTDDRVLLKVRRFRDGVLVRSACGPGSTATVVDEGGGG